MVELKTGITLEEVLVLEDVEPEGVNVEEKVEYPVGYAVPPMPVVVQAGSSLEEVGELTFGGVDPDEKLEYPVPVLPLGPVPVPVYSVVVYPVDEDIELVHGRVKFLLIELTVYVVAPVGYGPVVVFPG